MNSVVIPALNCPILVAELQRLEKASKRGLHLLALVSYENRSNAQAPLLHNNMGQFFDEVAAYSRAEMAQLDVDISARCLNRTASIKETAELQWSVLIDKFPQ